MPYVMQGFGTAPAVAIPGTTLTMTPEEFAVHVFGVLQKLEAMNRLVTQEWASLKAIANIVSTGGRLPSGIHPVLCDPQSYRDAGEAGPFALARAIECAKKAQQLLKPALGPVVGAAYLTTATLGPDWIAIVRQGGTAAQRTTQGAEIIRRLRALPPGRAQAWYKQAAAGAALASKTYYDIVQKYSDATVTAVYDESFWNVAASIAGAAADVFEALLNGAKEVVQFVARTAGELISTAGGGLLSGLFGGGLVKVLGAAVFIAGGYMLYRAYKKRKPQALPEPTTAAEPAAAPVGAFPMYRR